MIDDDAADTVGSTESGVLTTLTAADLAAVISTFAVLVADNSDGLDQMNVFPVADCDTGSNMTATAMAASADIATDIGSFSELGEAVVTGALRGAQGNSGLLLTQYWIGFFDAVRNVDRLDAQRLAIALESAADAARSSVAEPVDGTFLTVARSIADAALGASDAAGSLDEVIDAATEAGMDTLEATPRQLPVLAQHGVVDAGGAGLMLWVEALGHVVTGSPLDAPDREPVEPVNTAEFEVALDVVGVTAGAEATLRSAWSLVGTSVVVTSARPDAERDGSPLCMSAHVHTTEIGDVIEAVLAIGRPVNIRITPVD